MFLNTPPDWSIQPKPKSQRALLAPMTGAYSNEMVLVLNLDRLVEVSQIRIGFDLHAPELGD